MTFIDHFTCITKVCTIYVYLQQNWYISIPSACFSRCQYIPESLMHKNKMGIVGNNMRIKYRIMGKFFGKHWKELSVTFWAY